MKEEVLVGTGDFFNVVVAYGNLGGSIFLAQALFQHLGRGLQVDDQVRQGKLPAEVLVIAVVDLQLGIIEIDVGKNFVFLKDVISHYRFLRFTADLQMLELLKAPHHEGKLRLKGGAALAFIKSPQKRIVFRLNHALRVEPV